MNKKTKWKNARKDGAPSSNRDILISVDGIYYTAMYDSFEDVFKLKYELGKIFQIKNSVIYWMELLPPIV
jgi:hypothetical protein